MKRFLGNDRSGEITSLEERDRLARLLSKVEERKQKKDGSSLVTAHGQKFKHETVDDSTAVADDSGSFFSGIKKKRKKHKNEDEIIKDEIEDFIKRKPKKRKIMLLENGDDDDKDKEAVIANTEEQLVESEPRIEGKQSEGFTIIGGDRFRKKSKVKRVLPYWLANPTIISVNLQELGTSVDDIPGLDSDLVQRLKENGVHNFFPVQSKVIPWLLEAHKRPLLYRPCDVCVSSPTGSGKTLAFVLPIIQALKNRVVPHIRALVVLPVQDLAVQVFKVFRKYCLNTALKVALITGQNSFQKEQEQLLKTSSVIGTYSAVDIVVTTPGRLVDHIQCTRGFFLKYLRFLVIDEADRVMESVQNDWLYHVEKSINSGSHPFLTVASLQTDSPPPQKLLFSATLSQDPEKLQQLSLFQPKLFTSIVGEKIQVGGDGGSDELRGDFVGKYSTPAELQEKLCIVNMSSKPLVLYHLITTKKWQHVLCFTNSQQVAHRLVLLLTHLSKGKLKVAEISSALKRSVRDVILQKFAMGEYNIIISTDALARGMDIPGVDYVISYDPPKYVKTYIHRIGRTGRAGKPGIGVTFLLNNQLSHFQQTLHSAGKRFVDELNVPESDLKPYEEQYKEAIEALKQDLQKEHGKLLRRVTLVKKMSNSKVKTNIKNSSKNSR
ncbi:probable ATP-dependent RNA helicase Dbp73D isoform X2 [Anabrus simplex]|uniref:probable ATP-dependent RNA helicase Dbp73D isoform X2 n=1 Tax=Anabrus simplex TaxID=316456 RepID=UPI0035A3847A